MRGAAQVKFVMETIVRAGPYAPKLQEYLRLHRRYWRITVTFAGLVLLVFVAGIVLRSATSYPFSAFNAFLYTAVSVGFIVGIAAMWAGVRLFWWPCPRCGRAFASSLLVQWPGNRCKHCGLAVTSA
jgi:hypothetical protein